MDNYAERDRAWNSSERRERTLNGYEKRGGTLTGYKERSRPWNSTDKQERALAGYDKRSRPWNGLQGGSELFDEAYRNWLNDHCARRSGERRRKLEEGSGHSRGLLRNIWWEAFGHFHHLHPEYEWTDFNGIRRYIDLAYVRGPLKIAIEIDGFRTHTYQLSRKQFADQWVRHMHLLLYGWIVVRLSADDVHDRPGLWQQYFKQLIGKYFGNMEWEKEIVDAEEREILRMAAYLGRPFKLAMVREALDCHYRYARKVVQHLADKKWLVPVGRATQRVHYWQLNPAKREWILGY